MNVYYGLIFLVFFTCIKGNNKFSSSAITIYIVPDNSLLKKINDCDCSICFDDLIERKQKPLIVAHCKTPHIFHDECLKEWLNKEKDCPLCRNFIDTKNVEIVHDSSSQDLVGMVQKTVSFLLGILCMPIEYSKNITS